LFLFELDHVLILVNDYFDFDVQSKKSWFVLLKGIKLNRVAYGGYLYKFQLQCNTSFLFFLFIILHINLLKSIMTE
jgi:hypothetical protein